MIAPDPEQNLAAAVIAAADDEREALEAGKVPAPLAAAAASFAAARSSGSRWTGGMTPALAGYLAIATAFVDERGRAPTVTELAAAAGKSRTAAQDAIRRLRAMKRWPARDNAPHAGDQTSGVES